MNHKLIILVAMVSLYQNALAQSIAHYIPDRFKPAPHPRILLANGEEDIIKKDIEKDTLKYNLNYTILVKAYNFMSHPPIERILEGRRLLGKSRDFLQRVFFLSYAYRMTGDVIYAQRAEKEMLAVAAFSDWNPQHFLDVAEMATGMAIGYDWLYNYLPDSNRAALSKAIINMALKPSLDERYNFWVSVNHNWNQVCNAGMLLAAMAVYESDPALASNVIERSIDKVRIPMKEYGPDGAYVEGYSYWNYGTMFNVLLLSQLEKSFGSDFGLSNEKGFLETSNYMLHMTGPTGRSFNYADCGNNWIEISPAMFWFAAKRKDNSILYNQISLLAKGPKKSLMFNRFLPALLIWSKGTVFNKVLPPKDLAWVGEGRSPVALMRTSWTDASAVFVGLKAGSPSTNHGHMDIGSFVVDAKGERWAMDLGMEDYNKLETAGMNIWDHKQNGQRWQVFRYNNFAHNTLTVNDSLQMVEGCATISSNHFANDSMSATTDITSLYGNTLMSAKRTVAIAKNKNVVVSDNIVNSTNQTHIRWTLVTPALVNIVNDSLIQLAQNHKTVLLRLHYKGKAAPFVKTATPSTPVENPNKGVQITGFDFQLQPNQKADWKLVFDFGN